MGQKKNTKKKILKKNTKKIHVDVDANPKTKLKIAKGFTL